MQPFICPQCGHQSTFDPRVAPALCPQCGYTPPADPRQVLRLAKRGKGLRAQRARRPTGSHQQFLKELLSHWDDSHTPEPEFHLSTPYRAQTFFHDYQRALGEDPHLRPGGHMRYVRNYHPEEREVLWFVGAYLLLRHGKREAAAQHLHDLTRLHPDFADPWVWLTATTDDPRERVDYLENAVLLEPAHPLARDALAIALGRISPDGGTKGDERKVAVVNCPQCGGGLHYEPGASQVTCQYCGYKLVMQEVNLLEREARLVGDLRLQRRMQGHIWGEVDRIVHCEGCGAELTMTRHLSRECVFCGCTSVLVEDNVQRFEQPDGFLPFKLDEEQAAAAVEKAQHSTAQRLKSWWVGKERKLIGMKAIYLPFWVFDGFVEMRAQASSPFDHDSGSGIAVSSGLMTPRPRSVPLRRTMMFDNLLYSAVEFPPPQLLHKIRPFELKALVPYDPRLLADWPAVLYRRDVEEAVEDASDEMLAKAVWKAGPLIATESDQPAQLRRTFQVTSVTYQLVLLPVWVALVQREDRYRLALVNGQTSKVTFSSPVHGRPQ